MRHLGRSIDLAAATPAQRRDVETGLPARRTVYLHFSVKILCSWSTAMLVTGIRISFSPKRPVFTITYSGSPYEFTKSFRTRPILRLRGSQSV